MFIAGVMDGVLGDTTAPRPTIHFRSRPPEPCDSISCPPNTGDNLRARTVQIARCRVGLGGRPPRPPTDPDVRVDASGSSGSRFAARGYPPQLRRDRVSERRPSGLSLRRFRALVPLFPPRGPSAVPPLHRYFRGTPTPHGPSHFASLPSLSSTAVTSFASLPREAGRRAPVGLDLLLPVAHPAYCRRDHGGSQVPG